MGRIPTQFKTKWIGASWGNPRRVEIANAIKRNTQSSHRSGGFGGKRVVLISPDARNEARDSHILPNFRTIPEARRPRATVASEVGIAIQPKKKDRPRRISGYNGRVYRGEMAIMGAIRNPPVAASDPRQKRIISRIAADRWPRIPPEMGREVHRPTARDFGGIMGNRPTRMEFFPNSGILARVSSRTTMRGHPEFATRRIG